MFDQQRVRRESMRWYMLLAIYNARPSQLVEQVVQSTIRSILPDSTPLEIRQQLDYLEDQGLVELNKTPQGFWWCSLSHQGVDFVEYNRADIAGIDRPKKYWG